MRFKRFISMRLRRQLILGGLLALGISIGVIFLVYSAAELILDKTIYGEYYMSYVADQELNDLQSYITKNEIGVDDSDTINDWCYERLNRELLVIFDGDDLVYRMPVYGKWSVENIDEIEDYSDEELRSEGVVGEKTITFPGDDTQYTAYLYFHPSSAFYILAILLAGILGFLVFALVFIFLVRNKLKYIVQLKAELDVLAGGDLQYSVTERGKDEIYDLAVGINEMRKSILQKQIEEEKARQANSELVTSMSHDLRSPLTAMIGYLEILKRHRYDSEDQRDYFVDSSLKKALQIKSMSDKLFEYFLVSQSEQEKIEMEEFEVAMLIPELLEEYVFLLETEEYQTRSTMGKMDGSMMANPELLKRVFDNLYSNLKKYADASEPILVSCECSKGWVNLILSNAVKRDNEPKESTGIGLKTCEKILAYHGGTFQTHTEHGEKTLFVTEISLPMTEKK